ncbi:MAG: NADH-quinone oxidoreductase subunit C [Bacteroidia bacterium]|nr:NADH-quinone oxidoreductase subunit C [Bacteroidia bacterium]
MPDFQQIQSIVESAAQGAVTLLESTTPPGFRIAADDLQGVCIALRDHPDTYFDMLSCLTGLDNGADAATMEVIYNLYSVPYDLRLTLAVTTGRGDPHVPTVSHVWKTANWHEREAYDFYGINFTGHPDQRRILLPADWQGFPLRKDYQHESYYRGIKIEY